MGFILLCGIYIGPYNYIFVISAGLYDPFIAFFDGQVIKVNK